MTIPTPISLEAWAVRWRLPPEAMAELRLLYVPHGAPGASASGDPEAYAQSLIRLEAAQKGLYLWRNNVGAFRDDNGRFVRFGLANDSAQLNDKFKSSDLIGLRPLVIQPGHVGKLLGQFVAREVKAPGWTYTATPRERAQAAFVHLVQSNGGDASFTTGPGSL